MVAPEGGTTNRGAPVAYEPRAQRVLFGAGVAGSALTDAVARIGGGRVMLIAGPSEATTARQLASGVDVEAMFFEIEPHVPVEVAEDARSTAFTADVDVLVAVGGGSTIGVAKAVALRSGLPIVAIPTTFAGSEATDVWGLTEGGRKVNGTDPLVLPKSVIYDPELVVSLPSHIRVASGLNAIAHCVDSLWGPSATPISTALVVEGLRELATHLGAAKDRADDLAALAGCQSGTYLAAAGFAATGSGMHHKICHVLGGAYGLQHAATHAVLLPHVLGFNGPAAPDAERRIASALRDAGYGDGTDALAGLLNLYDALDAPRDLGSLGLGEEQVSEAAALALEKIPPSNPRTVTLDDVVGILTRAQSGAAPVRVPLT